MPTMNFVPNLDKSMDMLSQSSRTQKRYNIINNKVSNRITTRLDEKKKF